MCQVAALHSVNYMQSPHSPVTSSHSDAASVLLSVSFLALSSRSDMWLESRGRARQPERSLSLEWPEGVCLCWVGVECWLGCCWGSNERVRITEWICLMSSVTWKLSLINNVFLMKCYYWQPASLSEKKKCDREKWIVFTVWLKCAVEN